MRHGAHKANVSTPEATVMCHIAGNILKKIGYVIDAVVSSPAARAIETALETLHGYGKMVYLYTDVRLADTAINEEGRAAVTAAKKIMADRELSGEPELAKILFDPDGEFTDLMTRRGTEGANCLRKIGFEHPGKTILVPSHGIARIENTLMILRGENIHPPENLVKTCQIVEVILDSKTGEIIEENWLKPVGA